MVFVWALVRLGGVTTFGRTWSAKGCTTPGNGFVVGLNEPASVRGGEQSTKERGGRQDRGQRCAGEVTALHIKGRMFCGVADGYGADACMHGISL
jgi:hypothetical protein